jgi:hypothetical protein
MISFRKGYQLLRKHCLRQSAYSIKENKQKSDETAGDNHEGSISPNKGEDSGISTVESEETAENPSIDEHRTLEETPVNTGQEVQDDTSETNLDQMKENHSSPSSSNAEESEASDVTHEEVSVPAINQSSVESEQESNPRYSNTRGNTENDIELSKAARPVKSTKIIENFETWQQIIRLDAVRANDEWVSSSPSQTAVSKEKAIKSAKAVCLKDYEHLKPCRIHHASRLVAVLEAYAIYDPEIGYCQGMSDLLAPLLAVLEEDDDAFWCFSGFMRKARHNCRLDEAGIRRQLSMVARIIRYKDFSLYRHLEMLEAADCFFVYRMVVVMFRRELTFEQTLCLWEVMWADQAPNCAGIAKSSWQKLLLGSPPTDDLLLYAIAASVLQKRKLIIESYSSMDEIIRDCNSMAGQLDIWKLLDDAHDLVVTLHDRI